MKNPPQASFAAALFTALRSTSPRLILPRPTPERLRIGLADDPDMLDPTLARTYTGRIVFAAMCDKLVDITPELDVTPQLATEWKWVDGNKGLILKLRQGVEFQDGEPLDAAAVKFPASSAISPCQARTARPRSAR